MSEYLDILELAKGEFQRVRNALDEIDGTEFGKLAKLFDFMVRDLEDGMKYLATLEDALDKIEQSP